MSAAATADLAGPALRLAEALGGPLLALDSSSATWSLALVDPGRGRVHEVDAAAHGAAGPRGPAPSTDLVAALAALLAAAEVGPETLVAAAVGLGPGSFTGLRVGLATAKGLAMGRGLALAGASSLALWAAAAAPAPGEPPRAVWVLLDARRGDLFVGRYRVGPDGLPQPAHDDVVLAAAAVAALLAAAAVELAAGTVVVVGDPVGAALAAAHGAPAAAAPAPPRALAALLLAAPALHGPPPLSALVPRYLRPSEAERQRAARGC